MDIVIFIAFCLFVIMIGMRMRDYRKEKKLPIIKSINPDEPELVREKRERREKRARYFTIIQLFVLIGLIVFMSIILYKDIQSVKSIDGNFILKWIIFVFAIYILYIGYRKIMRSSSKNENQK